MNKHICHLCGARCLSTNYKVEDFEYFAPGVYEYLSCYNCGLLCISPTPSEIILNLAYPSNYHAYHEHFNLLSRLLKTHHWRKKAERYSKFITSKDKIIELGCAFGDLINEFIQIGFPNVMGLEYNKKAYKKAVSRGLNVVLGDITDLSLKNESVDMVIMENFIEHVYSPLDTMRRCYEYLKPGGFIVGETPNIDAWDYKMGGRFWGGYHAPRHIFLFNTCNLRLLAEKTGFEVVSIKNIIQPAHWSLTVQNALKHQFPTIKIIRGRSHFFLPLLFAFLPINAIQSVISKTSLVEYTFRKKS